MTEDARTAIDEYLMLMAENLPMIKRLTLDAGPLKGLTPQETHTIGLVAKLGRPRMSELAQRGRVTLGTMTVMINKLVKKGFVKRSRDDNDRRVVRVSLTDKGQRINDIHDRFHEDMLDRILSVLSESERRQLARIIRKVATSLG